MSEFKFFGFKNQGLKSFNVEKFRVKIRARKFKGLRIPAAFFLLLIFLKKKSGNL